jgi:TIR domain
MRVKTGQKQRHWPKFLTRQGWSVWWDRRIPIGETFGRVIEKQIQAAECVIVLWSKAALESDWVQNEASEGMQRGILAPVFIEDVHPPFEFRRIQAARLVDWNGETDSIEFVGLLEALNRIIGRGESLVQEPPTAEAERQQREKAAAAGKERLAPKKAEAERRDREKAAVEEREKVEAERREPEKAEVAQRACPALSLPTKRIRRLQGVGVAVSGGIFLLLGGALAFLP